jgi:hypothetical protein
MTADNYSQTAAGPSSWPHSGRGERRPQTAKARRTNSPLEPPAALRGKGQSAEYRRWNDLCRHYGTRLGSKRLADEGTRALLLNLIWVTLQIERIRDLPPTQQPKPETQLHQLQEQRALLQALGLNGATRSDDSNTLSDYLKESV